MSRSVPLAMVCAFAGVLLLAACGGGGASGSTPAQARAVPRLGIVSDDAFAARGTARARILSSQRRTGVQLIRQTFDWAQIERRTGHYAFDAYDGFVGAAATAGIDVLPILFGVPRREASKPARGAKVTATTTMPPRHPSRFAAFAKALVLRYGRTGSFWRENPAVPRHPITAWQVWNEPNLPPYWGGAPSARAYVALLRQAHTAIRAADPAAQVLTGGLPNSRTGIPLSRYLTSMYRAGARGTFEGLAIHPYASSAAGVIGAVADARRLTVRARNPGATIWVTEFGWASGGPGSSFTVSERRQAKLVLDTITGLAARAAALRLRAIVYYDWRDARPYPGKGDFWGLHTGLLRRNGTGKPALSAYYQAAGVLHALPAKSG